MDSGRGELIVVLAVMVVLFIFAVVAVVIFVRVWRKERR
jgi:Tfp pilus assembly protein PilX